jgi:carboxylesterase
MSALCAGAAIAAGVLLFLVFNLTSVFHRENPEYAPTSLSRLRAPEMAPYRREGGNERAVLLVHGFPSSPGHYRDICDQFFAEGYDAFAPLLPGHGTRPSDIHGTNFSQYYAFIRDYYLERRAAYRQFHLVGSSMGGVYSLRLAQEFGDDPRLAPSSVSTIGTPLIFFAPWRGIWTYPLIGIARAIGAFLPSVGAKDCETDRTGEDGDGRWRGYLGAYPKQAYSLLLGARAARKGLPLVRCPAYVFHARTDRIADYRNASVLMRGLGSPTIRHWAAAMEGFSHMRHDLLLYDSQRYRVLSELLRFFSESEGKDPC